MNKKSILLASGGLDSTALLLKKVNEGEEVLPVFIDLQQDSTKSELQAVKDLSGFLDTSLDVLENKGVMNAFSSSVSSASPAAVPNPGKHVLELGSLLVIPQAIAYAHKIGVEKIYIGYTKLDSDYSQEYSLEFLSLLSKISETAGFKSISIEAPFINTTKAEVLKLLADNRSLNFTWSCAHSEKTHCGVCQACRSRKDAFSSAGLKDNTSYRIAD